MKPVFRGFFLASLSVSVLAVAACSSTGSNVSNHADATRMDQILERAAREAKASGNKVETLALLEQIYKRNQEDPAVATAFGQALREDQQLNQARQVLYPFTEGNEAYPDAVIELAMVQLALGQYKEAELTSRRAIEIDPKSGRAFLALGTALDAQNYHEQAEVAFRKGIDQWKGDPAPIMNNLALNLASQNKLDQAIDMLKKAQEISPGRVELERNMRIITTLKEGADDFTNKQQAAATPAKPAAEKKEKEAAKKDPASKTASKKAPEVTVKNEDDSQEDVDNKQLTTKAEPSKPVTVKKETVVKKEAAPEKVEPAASGAPKNIRGSSQNFNSAKKQPETN